MAQVEPVPEKSTEQSLSTESKGPVALKFRNYTPHDPTLKKAILSSEDDASVIKKQILERFEALSNPETVRTIIQLILLSYFTSAAPRWLALMLFYAMLGYILLLLFL